MITEVLKLLMEYKETKTPFGGDLEADVGRRLATCDGLPFFRESEGMRLAVVMKILFEMHLITALGGDEEGEVFVHCDRVSELMESIEDCEKEDLEAQEKKK